MIDLHSKYLQASNLEYHKCIPINKAIKTIDMKSCWTVGEEL